MHTALEGSTLEYFCDGMLIKTERRAAKMVKGLGNSALKDLINPMFVVCHRGDWAVT